MIPTTITLTLDDKSIEAINRLISALEKVNPTSVAPVQPIAQVTPAAASTQPVVSTAAPVQTAQAPVQQPVVKSPVTGGSAVSSYSYQPCSSSIHSRAAANGDGSISRRRQNGRNQGTA